jgi:flagellar biosynthesis anti-sigma factor FlgM
MNINSNLEPGGARQLDAAAGRPSASSSAPAQSSSAPAAVLAGDTARISAAAQAAAAADADGVRAEKVASIQQALASGSYAVGASDVAGKLIDHLLRN